MPKSYVRDILLHLLLAALGVGANYFINGGWIPGLVAGLVVAAFITGVLRQRDAKASKRNL